MTDEVAPQENTESAPESEATIVTQPIEDSGETETKAEATPETPTKEVAAEPKAEEKSQEEPADYTKFTMPEGFENLNDDLLSQATPIFKESGMSQEQAQKLVDLFATTQTAAVDKQVAAFAELNQTNVKACEDHAEFGGQNLKSSVVHCARAMDALMGDKAGEFRKMLDETGIGNNPLMFELLTKFGKSIGEDGIVGGSNKPNSVPIENQMYGVDGRGPSKVVAT